MRIYFIIVDEPFFHPNFLQKMIVDKDGEDEIVGVTILPDKSSKLTFVSYLKKQYEFWGLKGFVWLSVKFIYYKFLDKVSDIFRLAKFYSVKSVAKFYSVPFYEVNNVNDPEHLHYLSTKKIDLVVSACGQIFKKELLAIPEIGIINRHSSLLPKYGGLWPVFWALLHDEPNVGVSVHWMEEKIDTGKVIYQEKILVSTKDTLNTLYSKAFAISSNVVLKAINMIKNNLYMPLKCDETISPSYYSTPTKEQIKMFKYKRRMI